MINYFSDSPMYFEVISANETQKGVAWISLHTAWQTMVFPTPGGPYKRILLNGFGLPLKRLGRTVGQIKLSSIHFLA